MLADGRLTGTGGISIHAPRKGERPATADVKKEERDFNPRSPQGGATK